MAEADGSATTADTSNCLALDTQRPRRMPPASENTFLASSSTSTPEYMSGGGLAAIASARWNCSAARLFSETGNVVNLCNDYYHVIPRTSRDAPPILQRLNCSSPPSPKATQSCQKIFYIYAHRTQCQINTLYHSSAHSRLQLLSLFHSTSCQLINHSSFSNCSHIRSSSQPHPRPTTPSPHVTALVP